MKKVIRSIKKAGQKHVNRMVTALSNTHGSGFVDQAVFS